MWMEYRRKLITPSDTALKFEAEKEARMDLRDLLEEPLMVWAGDEHGWLPNGLHVDLCWAHRN